MSWHPTNGRKPRTAARLKVKFANGLESRWDYTVAQLRWTETGHGFDVVAVRRA